jgi:hypothetical protein
MKCFNAVTKILELVLSISQGNHTYTTTVLSSFGLSINDEEYLPSLYSIQKVCASVYANYIILLELPRVLSLCFNWAGRVVVYKVEK